MPTPLLYTVDMTPDTIATILTGIAFGVCFLLRGSRRR